MPLEIRELHIKAVVSTEGEKPPAAPSAGQGGGGDQEAVVAACVEQVLEILREKAER